MCGAIARILKADFSHQVDGSKRKAMKDPETLMMALVVVSAKLRYPFDSTGKRAAGQEMMDWSRWQAVRQDKSAGEGHITAGEEHTVNANDVLTMDDTKLDDYMDWFESMFLGDENTGSKYDH